MKVGKIVLEGKREQWGNVGNEEPDGELETTVAKRVLLFVRVRPVLVAATGAVPKGTELLPVEPGDVEDGCPVGGGVSVALSDDPGKEE